MSNTQCFINVKLSSFEIYLGIERNTKRACKMKIS